MLMMPDNLSWYALARNDSQRGNNEKIILKALENDYMNFVEDEKSWLTLILTKCFLREL